MITSGPLPARPCGDLSVAWKIRLAAQAVADFSDIVTWTAQTFGERQAETYTETLTLAIETLHHGPEQLAPKARDDIMPGIRLQPVIPVRK